MTLYKRELTNTLKQFAKFRVVVVVGPRQSGKTTLSRAVFKKHRYLNLENSDIRDFALQDPNGFLRQNENEHGIIIDEFQYAPKLLSCIQVIVDEKRRPGYFVLTGSQNFLVNEAITQSLAGRAGILTLLPLSIRELIDNKIDLGSSNETIIKGFYPEPYAENFSPKEFYPSYIQTYVERDVRQIINVTNLDTFKNFIRLCAGRIGQIVNITDIAMQCGIDQRTANGWLSVLSASYILFLLRPYYKNFNKRVIKKPKLFFFDTGLAASLLGIRSTNDLALSPFRGHLFENLIIADLYKQYCNRAIDPPLYFWRNQNGNIEVDCIIDKAGKQIPVEVKAGSTISQSFFSGLGEWNKLAQADSRNSYVVYGGDLVQERNIGNVMGWKAASGLIDKIEQ
jgi:uncharacterized protein